MTSRRRSVRRSLAVRRCRATGGSLDCFTVDCQLLPSSVVILVHTFTLIPNIETVLFKHVAGTEPTWSFTRNRR